MQFNITTDYAVRTVLFLAIKKELTASSEIATAMDIPSHYILKITNKLAKGGIIKRYRGVKGGFTLAVDINDITLFDIVNLFEPTIKINRCLEHDEQYKHFAVDYGPVQCIYTVMQKKWEKMLKEVNLTALMDIKATKSIYKDQKDLDYEAIVKQFKTTPVRKRRVVKHA
jgi:Rrf2 family nitric oxide-sensitive transcriptional repressor